MFEKYEYSFLESVNSTQEYARKLIIERQKGISCFIIHTNVQSAGIGRSIGRSWISCPGDLTFSFAHKIKSIGLNITQVTYLIAVAVRNAIVDYLTEVDVFYKWPNDIVVKGRKLSGIIVEMVEDHLIIGVGMNIKSNKNVSPDMSHISMDDLITKNIEQKKIIERIINYYSELYDEYEKNGFVNICALWMKHVYQLGEKVNIYNFDNTKISGIFCGIDEMGSLLIKADGNTKEILDCQKLEFLT